MTKYINRKGGFDIKNNLMIRKRRKVKNEEVSIFNAGFDTGRYGIVYGVQQKWFTVNIKQLKQ
jgi:hypothetical protein